jgi:hypothetical protein
MPGQRADEIATFVREHSEVVSPGSGPSDGLPRPERLADPRGRARRRR